MKDSDLTNPKPIAVLGGGVSGVAAAELLRREGCAVSIFDEAGGKKGLVDFDPSLFQFVVVSPGVPFSHNWRKISAQAGLRVIGETALAASRWKGRLACVTGTNGKTTLTRFLADALRRNGEKASPCGNIGKPLSELCLRNSDTKEWAVCETSSFQFFDWEKPALDVGFWTNFDEDHLDWHENLEEYFEAKRKIVECGSTVFADLSIEAWFRRFGYSLPGNLRLIDTDSGGKDRPIGVFQMKPWHRLFALAEAWWKETGRPLEVLEDAARRFGISPHRLESLGEYGGVRFINDSKATNTHATLAALEGIEGPVHWLGGGSNKGENLNRLASCLARRIQTADTFGATGERLAQILRSKGCVATWHRSLQEATASAVWEAQKGSTILLSPGFASFDQFSGYAERGEVFREEFSKLV